MLEARHLCKTYKTKKGVNTKALDDVSVTFAEKGMVFILGKSGSGKSTLLNVCGGLDTSDSGEIVIKGRSSADKGEFDFDSYRNTFVGFVFQEYNILEEFSVEENVGLALELQHKKRDKETIAKILADVDMTEFASRKPNTLSGGQKQRVAIARALVKNPEIIMADEPTGALDSNTGKQVFDTLKKLSKDKLVLIVSHDREFAEQYGDRIIELKDGKIISDMTREETETDGDKKNVRFVGTDTVCVASGAQLTEQDFADIKAFLQKSKGQTVITASRDKVDNITRELRGGEFNETAEQPAVREYAAHEKKMIRSRLPMRHAVKMGASSLKSKPVRLVFTVLLSVIAFLLFGVSSTLMMYDADKVTTNAFMESEYSFINLSKGYYVTDEYWRDGKLEESRERIQETDFTQEDAAAWQKKYPNAIAAVSTAYDTGSVIANLTVGANAQCFYGNRVDFVALDNGNVELLAGEHPMRDDEILISDYLFRAMQAGTLYRVTNGEMTDDETELNEYRDVLGASLLWGNKSGKIYTVTGVFAGENVPEGYSKLKEAADSDSSYAGSLRYEWEEERRSGLYASIAVTENVFADLGQYYAQDNSDEQMRILFDTTANVRLSINGSQEWSMVVYGMAEYRAAGKGFSVYNGNGDKMEALSQKQIALSAYEYGNVLQMQLQDAINEAGRNDPDQSYQDMYEEFYGKSLGVEEAGYQMCDTNGRWIWVPVDCVDREHWENRKCPDYPDRIIEVRIKTTRGVLADVQDFCYATDEAEGLAALRKVRAFIQKYDLDIPEMIMSAENSETGNAQNVTVAGMYFTLRISGGYAYVSSDLFALFRGQDAYEWKIKTAYDYPRGAFISALFISYDGSEHLARELIEISGERDEHDACAVIGNALYDSLTMINEMVADMGKIFLWVGVVLAAFAFLLMFNFISSSISSKKKEIGILRAIGSRTLDVFKIFLAEAFIIALICFVVATAGSFGVCALLNNIMMSESAMINTGLLLFGPISVLIIAAIALVTSVIATVVPVALYSRKPPVASIRAL